MSRVLPILFNTDMVRAILDGRKTVTRRLVKHDVDEILNSPYHKEHPEVEDKQIISKLCVPPYKPGDILYVRETWEHFDCCSCEGDEHGNCPKETQKSVLDKFGYGCYMYRASDEVWGDAKWHPSIHMPKVAARIWLNVKDVRVERLQEIDDKGAYDEGAGEKDVIYQIGGRVCDFTKIWNSTIKKSDLDRYGWDANPWVWVIEFERCEKPENI